MTSTTGLITELVRAANEVEMMEFSEARRLLNRSVVIRDMRDQIGIPGSQTAHDAVIGLQTVAASMERRDKREISRALLDAADMIRTLHIVLDTDTHTYRPSRRHRSAEQTRCGSIPLLSKEEKLNDIRS